MSNIFRKNLVAHGLVFFGKNASHYGKENAVFASVFMIDYLIRFAQIVQVQHGRGLFLDKLNF